MTTYVFSPERFKLAVLLSGKKKKDIANDANCTSTDIWRYEQGSVVPSADRIESLAAALGVDVVNLTDGSASDNVTKLQESKLSAIERYYIEWWVTLPEQRRAFLTGYMMGLSKTISHTPEPPESQ